MILTVNTREVFCFHRDDSELDHKEIKDLNCGINVYTHTHIPTFVSLK